MKAPSESTMLKYWRAAVRAKRGNQCIWDGCHNKAEEIHHYVHRRYKLTVYDAENGAPLCKGHHAQADRLYGREIIRGHLNWAHLESISKFGTVKNSLSATGQTRAEFLHATLARLKEIIREADTL